jgi:hypothetical protein
VGSELVANPVIAELNKAPRIRTACLVGERSTNGERYCTYLVEPATNLPT